MDYYRAPVPGIGRAASEGTMYILASSKKRCDEDLQKVLGTIHSFLENVLPLDQDHPFEVGTHASREPDEVTQSDGPSPRRHISGPLLSPNISSMAMNPSDAMASLDPSQTVFRDILSVGNEMINTSLETFLTDAAACQYFVTKLRNIGKIWQTTPHGAGQNWHSQVLLAVSRFSRALKWYHADQYPEVSLGNENKEPWSFFVSKSSRWYYKDTKGKIHGPWKDSLMDSWNKEGLLHPNLLVRREEDPEYTLLKDLQLSSSDPSHPFQDSVENAPGSIKDFDIIRILHKGPSNSVFLARRIATSHTFAVKVIAKPEMFTKNKMTIIRAKRMAILNQSDSPFVNRIHFAFQSKSKVYLVKELLPQGDCAALISSLGRIGEAVATDYTFQVAQGLEYLHHKGIIHRDLRPENILMDAANRLKLADFGMSHKAFLNRNIGVPSEQTINSSQFFRTIYYLTPEAVLGLQDSDPSIDWWALGIIAFEFLHGITPYEGGELELVLQKILSGKINWSSSTVPSNAARDFIQDLLHTDPGKRCSFRGAEGVKAHHFLNNRREDIPTTANLSPTSSPDRAKFDRLAIDLGRHLPDASTSADVRPVNLPSSLRRTERQPSDRSLSKLNTGRDPRAPLYSRQSSQGSSADISSTYRRPSRSNISTRSTSRRRTSSRSSTGRGSSWLSGYTTTDSDPESDGSLISPGISTRSSRWEWDIPGNTLPVNQHLQEDLDLTGKVIDLDKYPFESGGVADIYSGTLKSTKLLVAVKIFRRMHSERETLERTSRYLYQEAQIWRQLDHPNILPFLGISLDLGLSPALISPLCVSGPIMKYLQQTKQGPREKLQMVIGVANGLAYLHSEGIVHGNLCTKKILIDAHGSPVICGYGMSKAVRQPAYTTSLFSSPIRFASPESFSAKTALSVRTESGDVYSFSMVTLEILSGLPPYHHLPTEHAVFIHIVRGGRPSRGHLDHEAVTTDMWRFLASVWNQSPSLRPTMLEVVQNLVYLRDKMVSAKEANSVSNHGETEPDSAQDESDSSSGSEASVSLGDIALPEVHGRDLKGRITQDDQYPFAGGGNSNIYRGKLTRSNGRKIRVAIKMIRMSDDGSGQMEDVLRQLNREAEVWGRLKHKNVLPFIGVCKDIAPWPVLISPFYKLGHVGTYLRKHPSANRGVLVRGVASGLRYLHTHDIIHGDLKVQNVLVDKRGAPCICDFGISKIMDRRGFTMSSVGTAPYMAPELFFVVDGPTLEQSSPSTTKSSDVYSFALLVLEILTSEPPKGRPSRPIVTAKILADLRPKRADYDEQRVTDEIWSVLNRCWTFEPHLRPAIFEVQRELASIFQMKTVAAEAVTAKLEKFITDVGARRTRK